PRAPVRRRAVASPFHLPFWSASTRESGIALRDGVANAASLEAAGRQPADVNEFEWLQPMGRVGKLLTFVALVLGAYFALHYYAPAPLHDFLVLVDDFASTVHGWVHSAETTT